MTAGRTAIVTGGGSGIGLAISQRLAADGNAVAVFDRDATSAEAAAAGIVASGGTAVGLTVDVTDRSQIDDGVAAVRERLGRPTILVNSAGLDGFDPFLKITAEKWNRILAVNLTGTFDCCQAVVPDMIEEGWGRIVNISSSSAHGGQPLMTHYVASKAGVIGFTKALALELGPQGITVNTIPPGFIDTPMLRASERKGLLGKGVEHHESMTPVRRVGTPEDIAAACSFLVRDEAELHHRAGHRGQRRPEHLMARIPPLPPEEWSDGDAGGPGRPASGQSPPFPAPPRRAARRRSTPWARWPGIPSWPRPSTPSTATSSSPRPCRPVSGSCWSSGWPRSGTRSTSGRSTPSWPAMPASTRTRSPGSPRAPTRPGGRRWTRPWSGPWTS